MLTDIAEEHGTQHKSVSLGNTVPLISLEQILHQEDLPFPYMRGLINCGFQQGIQVFHKLISSIFVIVFIINIVILNVQNIDIIGQKIMRVNRFRAPSSPTQSFWLQVSFVSLKTSLITF
jgi:hypothetical protein